MYKPRNSSFITPLQVVCRLIFLYFLVFRYSIHLSPPLFRERNGFIVVSVRQADKIEVRDESLSHDMPLRFQRQIDGIEIGL